MEYNEEHIVLFNRYLSNELSEDEVTSFEKGLEDDPQLRSSFLQFQAIRTGIELNATEHLLSEMNEWDEEISDKKEGHSFGLLPTEPPTQPIPLLPKDGLSQVKSRNAPWKKTIAIAASILLLSLVIWQLTHAPTPINPPENFEHYPSNIGIKRSSTPQDIPTDKVKAYNLYEIKEYKLAAPLLEKWYQSSGEQDALFYAGVAYYGSGNISKASEIFRSQKWPVSQQGYIDERFR